MKISIIIVNWNIRNLLEGCLSSIYSYSPVGEFEVFVIDNASTDGSPQMVKEHFAQVHLIENRENVGFARANNQGIEQSVGQYVLLLNPDTIIKPGAIDILVKFMDTNPKSGGVGARLLNPDGTLQPWSSPFPTLLREFWRLFHLDALFPYSKYEMNRWATDTPHIVDMLPGACLLLRRDALYDIGNLDEDYFIYSEEVDLCYRLSNAGWFQFWVPRAVIIHYGGQSTMQVAEDMFIHLYRSKILYFRKHQGNIASHVYKLLLIFASIVRLLGSPISLLMNHSECHKHIAKVQNYFKLLKSLPSM